MVDLRKVEGVDPSGNANEWVIGATPQGQKLYRVRFTVRIYNDGKWKTFSPDAPSLTDEDREKVRNVVRKFVQSNAFSEFIGTPSSFYSFSIIRKDRKFVLQQKVPQVVKLKVNQRHQYFEELEKGFQELLAGPQENRRNNNNHEFYRDFFSSGNPFQRQRNFR